MRDLVRQRLNKFVLFYTVNDTQIIKKDNIEIRVIRSKCIGASTCVVYAPETFDLDKEGIAIIKNGEWNKWEKILAAAKSCPTFAIEVYLDGKKVYPES